MHIILSTLSAIATKLLFAATTKNMLEWLLFKTAEAIVKRTDTTQDDEFLAKLKESYEAKK